MPLVTITVIGRAPPLVGIEAVGDDVTWAGRPCVGAYWRALASPTATSSASSVAAAAPGNVCASGKPPANGISVVSPASARMSASPAPTARVRAAKRSFQLRASRVSAIGLAGPKPNIGSFVARPKRRPWPGVRSCIARSALSNGRQAASSTLKLNIIPLSWCSAMWQCAIHVPGS